MGGIRYFCPSFARARRLISAAAVLSLAWPLAGAPALALDIDGSTSMGFTSPVPARPDSSSVLVGDSARKTADSDPASFKSGDGAVSDKADTAQSIYCKDKGGVVWIAANVLSSLANKPNDTYQVEPMRCP